jgi:hypothetical protein
VRGGVRHPVQHAFAFGRIKHEIAHSGTPPRRHEEKQVKCAGTKALCERKHGRQFIRIVPGNRGVDLDGKSGLVREANCAACGIKRAVNAPEGIVRCGMGSIEADTDAGNARIRAVSGVMRWPQGAMTTRIARATA